MASLPLPLCQWCLWGMFLPGLTQPAPRCGPVTSVQAGLSPPPPHCTQALQAVRGSCDSGKFFPHLQRTGPGSYTSPNPGGNLAAPSPGMQTSLPSGLSSLQSWCPEPQAGVLVTPASAEPCHNGGCSLALCHHRWGPCSSLVEGFRQPLLINAPRPSGLCCSTQASLCRYFWLWAI